VEAKFNAVLKAFLQSCTKDEHDRISRCALNAVACEGHDRVVRPETESLQMFCPLLANPQVNLNLPNSRGETPLDIAEYKIPKDGGELILYNGLVIHSFYSILFSSLNHACMHA
jgi:hypothetical protein